ncbi:MAG: hypothetical protein GY759_17320 [Chloroflexi bacterium]|nr:hypothetical protein [Chloroflexota bacterium]
MAPRVVRQIFGVITLLILLSSVSVWADEEDVTWGAMGGPVAFVTHVAADAESPDFVMIFLALAVQRNNDRTQTSSGSLQRSWSPYFSMDGGATWQPASNDLAHVEPTVLEITKGEVNNTIWVGTSAHGLWRSENNGRTWRPVPISVLDNQRIVALTMDVRGRLHLLTLENASFPSSYLYTSTDNGYNWSHRIVQSYTSNPATLVTDLIADPFDVNQFYAPTFGGLLVTEDAGFTWQQSSITLPESVFAGKETVLAVDPTQRGRLYLLMRSTTAEEGELLTVYRSLDSAQTWETLSAEFTFPSSSNRSASLRPLKLQQDPLNRRQLFLATSNGLWLSNDSGLTWRLAGTALSGVSMSDFVISSRQRGRWITAGAGGMWQTANGGSQWRSLANGLPPASNVSDLAVTAGTGNTLLALSGGDMPIDSGRHPVWRSDDGGQTWFPVMRGLEDINLLDLVPHPLDANVIYGRSATGVARTDDKGRSWQYFPLSFNPTSLVVGQQDHVFAGSREGVWRSTNKGGSWKPTSLEDPIQALAVAANGDVLAIATSDTGIGQVWRSEDAGLAWYAQGVIPEGDVNLFVAHPRSSNVVALTLQWAGLYVSNDGGQTWARRDTGIPSGTRWQGAIPQTPDGPNLIDLFIDPTDPSAWWASRDGGGIYRSTDSGQSWTDASADLGDHLIQRFARSKDRLIAGSSNLGLLERMPIANSQEPPAEVDVRIEILWPHDFASVDRAEKANMGLRVYKARNQEPPPCAWTPTVEVWIARDAEPLRRLGPAEQRSVEEHPFPFWESNDIDVTWANDADHKLIFLARVSPTLAQSQSSPWIHAADARTYLPEPPQPTDITSTKPEAIDALIRVVWPHDQRGRFETPDRANLVNISAVLVAQDTLLALAPDYLPERVWLIGSLDNQVGRRLAVGEPQVIRSGNVEYTTFEFNDIDVSLARDAKHHWTFWLEVPEMKASTNVWVHGIDSRTHAPELLEPIVGCRP